MYLGYQNGKIKFYTENELDPALYNLDKVEQTSKKYVLRPVENSENEQEYVLYDSVVKAQILKETKEAKYQEALQGAKDYIANEAYYRYDDNNTIEATDGNIGKLTSYAMALSQGLFESVTWTSKEDNVLTLTLEDVTKILTGVGAVQADIWNVQFVAYKNEIENATTQAKVEKIEIVYNSEGANADTATDDTTADTVSDEVETADSATETEQSDN